MLSACWNRRSVQMMRYSEAWALFEKHKLIAKRVPCTHEHHGDFDRPRQHQRCSLCTPACPIVAVAGCSHPRLPAPRCHSSVSRLHAQRLVFMQMLCKRMPWLQTAPPFGECNAFLGYPLLLLLLLRTVSSIGGACQSSSTNSTRPRDFPRVCMSAHPLSMVQCEDEAMTTVEQIIAKAGGRTRSCWAMARGCEPAFAATQVRAAYALPMCS